jgi:hypothetical protein
MDPKRPNPTVNPVKRSSRTLYNKIMRRYYSHMIFILYSVCAILFIGIVFWLFSRAQTRNEALSQDQTRFETHRNELLHILAAHEAKKHAEAEAAEEAAAEEEFKKKSQEQQHEEQQEPS